MKGHCCFGGCTPRPCGCCVYAIFHEEGCPDDPMTKLKELDRRIEEAVQSAKNDGTQPGPIGPKDDGS